MTLKAAAIARPLDILDASHLHIPLLVMLASLVLVILLAVPKGYLSRITGGILLAIYPLFIVAVLLF
jgi:cation:H+ antiporter